MSYLEIWEKLHPLFQKVCIIFAKTCKSSGLVPLKPNESSCSIAWHVVCVCPFDSCVHECFGVKESGKVALNGGWHFSFLTGSAYVDEWQFFLRGRSGWREFVFNFTLFISEPAKWTCRHILGEFLKKTSQLGFKTRLSHAADTVIVAS